MCERCFRRELVFFMSIARGRVCWHPGIFDPVLPRRSHHITRWDHATAHRRSRLPSKPRRSIESSAMAIASTRCGAWRRKLRAPEVSHTEKFKLRCRAPRPIHTAGSTARGMSCRRRAPGAGLVRVDPVPKQLLAGATYVGQRRAGVRSSTSLVGVSFGDELG